MKTQQYFILGAVIVLSLVAWSYITQWQAKMAAEKAKK
jgi:hypothetical protein